MSEFFESVTYHSFTPFIGAHMKLIRARYHLDELARAEDFLSSRFAAQFMIGVDNGTGEVRITYITDERMSYEYAAIVGDVVHNVRSALDHVAVVLTIPPFGSGGKKGTSFPTGEDSCKFLAERDKKMRGASIDAGNLVAAMEPYQSGQFLIRELHQIDINDKHKLIIPTVARLSVERLVLQWQGSEMVIGKIDFVPNEDGSNFDAVVRCPGAKLGDVRLSSGSRIRFSITFANGQPLAGHPIRETLSSIAVSVQAFVDRCEARFSPNARLHMRS